MKGFKKFLKTFKETDFRKKEEKKKPRVKKKTQKQVEKEKQKEYLLGLATLLIWEDNENWKQLEQRTELISFLKANQVFEFISIFEYPFGHLKKRIFQKALNLTEYLRKKYYTIENFSIPIWIQSWSRESLPPKDSNEKISVDYSPYTLVVDNKEFYIAQPIEITDKKIIFKHKKGEKRMPRYRYKDVDQLDLHNYYYPLTKKEIKAYKNGETAKKIWTKRGKKGLNTIDDMCEDYEDNLKADLEKIIEKQKDWVSFGDYRIFDLEKVKKLKKRKKIYILVLLREVKKEFEEKDKFKSEYREKDDYIYYEFKKTKFNNNLSYKVDKKIRQMLKGEIPLELKDIIKEVKDYAEKLRNKGKSYQQRRLKKLTKGEKQKLKKMDLEDLKKYKVGLTDQSIEKAKKSGYKTVYDLYKEKRENLGRIKGIGWLKANNFYERVENIILERQEKITGSSKRGQSEIRIIARYNFYSSYDQFKPYSLHKERKKVFLNEVKNGYWDLWFEKHDKPNDFYKDTRGNEYIRAETLLELAKKVSGRDIFTGKYHYSRYIHPIIMERKVNGNWEWIFKFNVKNKRIINVSPKYRDIILDEEWRAKLEGKKEIISKPQKKEKKTKTEKEKDKYPYSIDRITEIKGIGKDKRKKLQDEGCKTIQDVYDLGITGLTEIKGIGQSTAKKIIKGIRTTSWGKEEKESKTKEGKRKKLSFPKEWSEGEKEERKEKKKKKQKVKKIGKTKRKSFKQKKRELKQNILTFMLKNIKDDDSKYRKYWNVPKNFIWINLLKMGYTSYDFNMIGKTLKELKNEGIIKTYTSQKGTEFLRFKGIKYSYSNPLSEDEALRRIKNLMDEVKKKDIIDEWKYIEVGQDIRLPNFPLIKKDDLSKRVILYLLCQYSSKARRIKAPAVEIKKIEFDKGEILYETRDKSPIYSYENYRQVKIGERRTLWLDYKTYFKHNLNTEIKDTDSDWKEQYYNDLERLTKMEYLTEKTSQLQINIGYLWRTVRTGVFDKYRDITECNKITKNKNGGIKYILGWIKSGNNRINLIFDHRVGIGLERIGDKKARIGLGMDKKLPKMKNRIQRALKEKFQIEKEQIEWICPKNKKPIKLSELLEIKKIKKKKRSKSYTILWDTGEERGEYSLFKI
jgi:hypothetical protein